jgi:acyl-CoA thioesterase-2
VPASRPTLGAQPADRGQLRVHDQVLGQAMMAAARTDDEVPAEVHSDPLLANCLLAYVSDWTILDPVQIGVGKTWQTLDAMASLDHAMWFHRPVDFSDWLLYEQRSPSAVAGRGLGFGAIYNRTGELVCTVAQEGYLGRLRRGS